MKKVLLIDGDIVAYQMSATTQRTYELPEADAKVVTTDADAAIRGMVDTINGWVRKLKADKAIVCLSDDFSNYRKKVLPSYKEKRVGSERPVLLYDMKDALADYFDVIRWPHLEADDVMGILASEPQDEEKRCIVSEDKDMRTIPAWVWNPANDEKPVLISEEDANRWFLKQTLMGDPTDGYKGCPDIGPAKADEILDGAYLERREREITRGKRKGQIEVKYVMVPAPDMTVWERIVRTFEAKGLTEEDALAQARCAFILRHGHYEDGRITHWTPKGSPKTSYSTGPQSA